MSNRSSRRYARAVVALIAVGLLTACGAPPPWTGDDTKLTRLGTVTVDGVERRYLLYLPDNVLVPATLVVMLHGGFGSAKQAQEAYGWDDEADRSRFAVVYPDGDGRAWSVGGGVRAAGTVGDR